MYEESLGLSKADRLWRDALETAASSKEISVAEELAGYFVSIGNKDAFAAILYVCFELVRPDFVEEMVSRRDFALQGSGSWEGKRRSSGWGMDTVGENRAWKGGQSAQAGCDGRVVAVVTKPGGVWRDGTGRQ
jgi:hypothetical protein